MYIYKIVAVFSVFHGNLLNFFQKLPYFCFGPSVMIGRVLWISFPFCPFQKLSWDWLISYFWNSAVVLEAHVVLYVTEQLIFPKNRENGLKMDFFEFIGKFSHHFFFLNLVYNKSLYYIFVIFLHKSHICENLVP